MESLDQTTAAAITYDIIKALDSIILSTQSPYLSSNPIEKLRQEGLLPEESLDFLETVTAPETVQFLETVRNMGLDALSRHTKRPYTLGELRTVLE